MTEEKETERVVEGLLWGHVHECPDGRTWWYGIGIIGPFRGATNSLEEAKRLAREAVLDNRRRYGVERAKWPEPRIVGGAGKPYLREASELAGGIVYLPSLGAWLPNDLPQNGKTLMENVAEFHAKEGSASTTPP
ncbi:hypothetical protein [Verrucomicrobium sp. 3C]|uniref:hypothetical protein n=1 Tax=Verrucomicrobium sp. 3C TaxID=1134055 RepID=UPI000382393B|nr:hypothetical protein [Verrucomicrobium sp. 3C]